MADVKSKTDAVVDFDLFVHTHGDRLRCLLAARYGVDVGNDVCAEALSHAWENWARIRQMANPVGYLYRVAQSASRRHFRWSRIPLLPPEQLTKPAEPEFDLRAAMVRLPQAQRVSVLLVHAFGWSYDEVAEVLDVPLSTVRNHVHRGTNRLRRLLEN